MTSTAAIPRATAWWHVERVARLILVVALAGCVQPPPSSSLDAAEIADASDAADASDTADASMAGSETGAACEHASDCGSGLCLPLPNGPLVCTSTCSADGDCVSGWTCLPSPGLEEDVCQCEPSAETCNGADDDCDGVIDNDAATTPACAEEKGEGSVCTAGSCSCALQCGADCVNPAVDQNHCGACGHACPAMATCQAGECVCSAGLTACNGSCVDLLTDVHHCGACGHVCNGICLDGARCLQALTSQAGASTTGLGADVDYLYWGDGNRLKRIRKQGGTIQTLATASHSGKTADVAVMEGFVFWNLNGDPSNGQDTQLIRVPLAGGTPETLAAIHQTSISNTVAREGVVYYGLGDAVYSVTAMGQPERFAESALGSLFAHPAGLLGITGSSNAIVLLSLAGSTRMTLASATFGPPIAADNDAVYTVQGTPLSNSHIVRFPVNGGAPSILSAEPMVNLAVDAEYIYGRTADLSVVKMPIAGGAASTLAPFVGADSRFIVDADAIYWIAGGTLRKVSPH